MFHVSRNMRQYQVPQFITVEDKVIGPLTVKQALYVGAGVLLIVFAKLFFEPFLFWPIAALVGSLSGALAFITINGIPFPAILKNAVLYFIKPHLFVWKKREPKKQREKEEMQKKKQKDILIKNIPKMSKSKLSDLAWSLDIKEKTRT